MQQHNEVTATPLASEVPHLTEESLRKVAENVEYKTRLATIDAVVQALLQMRKLAVNNAR